MRAAFVCLLALATAGAATLAVAEPPRPYPPPAPYPAPSPEPAPKLPPSWTPDWPPNWPKDPLGSVFPLPIPMPDAETQALLREGADKLLRAIERMIETMPVYELPEITPEGDIILRRRPAPEPPPRRTPSPWPSLPAPPPGPRPAPPIERTTI